MGLACKKTPIRVMLVDDHRTMLWGLQQLIDGQRPRMEVAGIASNVSDALEQARLHRPDIVLLDVDLGGRNSLDILPELLADGRSKVLLLTGMRDQAALDEAILDGAHGLVRKEEPATALLHAIEKVHCGGLWLDQEANERLLKAMQAKSRKAGRKMKADNAARLTPKERQVIETIVREPGEPNKVVAQRLVMSEHTLRNHLTSIYQKLGVDNRLKLYVHAVKQGLGDRKA